MLSNKKNSEKRIQFPNKNLAFCPRPNVNNSDMWHLNLVSFYSNIKLKAHFGQKEQEKTTFSLKGKGSLILPNTHKTIITSIPAVKNNLNKVTNTRDKLTKKEEITLKRYRIN